MMKLMSQLHPNGKVGIIGIGIAPVVNILYLQERQKFWAKHFGLEVVGESDSPTDDASGGETAMAGLLNKQVDGVVCYTDTVCVGADAAARQSGQKIATVAVGGGPGAIHAVKNGKLTGTFQRNAVQWGVQQVRAAYNLIEKKDVPPIVVLAPVQAITKETAENVVTWDEELDELDQAG